MGRHGRDEIVSSILVRVCKIMIVILMVVQSLLLQSDIRYELSLVDKLEGIPLVGTHIDESPLEDKILTTILSFIAGKFPQ